jgi:hypothetical protein
MRELMESFPGSYVTVFVTSNHAFSGARSFRRAKFTEKDFTLIENRAVTSEVNWGESSMDEHHLATEIVGRRDYEA